MLPLIDVIPPRTRPTVTLALVALTGLVAVVQIVGGPGAEHAIAAAMAFTPAALSPLRLASSLVVHLGGWQAGVNTLLLWLFGENMEDRLGHARFFGVYALCGIVAGFVHTALHPESHVPVAAACGAIAGVLGGYFVTYPQSRVLALVPVPALVVEIPSIMFLALWWAIQVLTRLRAEWLFRAEAMGLLDFWALVAAFIAGALATLALRKPPRWDA